MFCVAHNREKTDRVKTRGFCPRGTKVDLPQGLRITKDAARHLEISEQVKKVKKVPPDIQLRFMQKSFFTQII